MSLERPLAVIDNLILWIRPRLNEKPIALTEYCHSICVNTKQTVVTDPSMEKVVMSTATTTV